MNMDYVHAAKVIADLLVADDTAYEAYPDAAFEFGKRAVSALQSAGFALSHTAQTAPAATYAPPRDERGLLAWGTCDGCGEDIAPEFLQAATQVPPDYLPEDFRKRATTVLCQRCRPEA